MDRTRKRQPTSHRWRRPGSLLTIVVVGWWLVLGGMIVSVMPEHAATAAPSPSGLSANVQVRIAKPNSPPFRIARDRAGFDTMRLALAARYEDRVTDASLTSIPAFEWISVEHGQLAYVVVLDGDAVQIEMLEGEHAGERGWIRRDALGPKAPTKR